jgi:MFS family permease
LELSVASDKFESSLCQSGTVVALLQVGAALGGVMCFLVGDILGRRRTTILAAVIVLLGTVIQASSFKVAQLIVGRLVTGIEKLTQMRHWRSFR